MKLFFKKLSHAVFLLLTGGASCLPSQDIKTADLAAEEAAYAAELTVCRDKTHYPTPEDYTQCADAVDERFGVKREHRDAH